MQSKNLQENTIKVVDFHKNIANDLITNNCKRKESPLDEDKKLIQNDVDDSDEEGKILNFENFLFDRWIDKSNGKSWVLNNGDKIRDILLKVTRQKINEANKLLKIDVKLLNICICRLVFSSIIDLSSEFEEGMYLWFGEEWESLKEKASKKIKFNIQKFEGKILSDITKIEEASETVFKSTVCRKIDLRILTIDNNIELSHSEFASNAKLLKIIKDHSKCIRTNKCILDTYLMHNLSGEAVENSTFYGLQSAGLQGQIFGIDLLDDGLYFCLEGPTYRFPAQLNNIKSLKSCLEVLYFFKEILIYKVGHLTCDNNNDISKILSSKKTNKKPIH
ncbi:hypothetical protein Glove_212g51 [Diversispora epigaea]|uniref:Uncharacterized protein n=1 Tax=Diversispora epigaea TaxID=1348612 RepID=A0A397IID9_9GLOM|nr:hypothetical protein Glove_212g51 [Diversispora epigaea]